MSTPTPVKNAKLKMEPREAGRAPPKKQLNDGKDHEKNRSSEIDVRKGEGKDDNGDEDGGDSHMETWAEFLKRSGT